MENMINQVRGLINIHVSIFPAVTSQFLELGLAEVECTCQCLVRDHCIEQGYMHQDNFIERMMWLLRKMCPPAHKTLKKSYVKVLATH